MLNSYTHKRSSCDTTSVLITFLSGRTPDNLLMILCVLHWNILWTSIYLLSLFSCAWILAWIGNCEQTNVQQPFLLPWGLVLSNVIALISCQRHTASLRIRLWMHTILLSSSYESQLKVLLKVESLFFVYLQLLAEPIQYWARQE